MGNKEWTIENNTLIKVFEFDNFVEAVSFVDKIVKVAEELKHHPDVEIFSFNKVKIKLTTHDKGGVSDLDYELSKKIDQI